MVYDLTPKQLAAAGQQVIDEGEDLYDMGRRHEGEMYEAAILDQKNKEEETLLAAQQIAYENQLQTWENQGIQPENLARAKAQLATIIGTPGTQPVPGPQNAPAYAQEQPAVASPTQGDLINPANPMKLV